jgi:hypothetical protein
MGHLSTSVIEHFQRELSNYIISRQHYELILDSVGNVLLQGSTLHGNPSFPLTLCPSSFLAAL